MIGSRRAAALLLFAGALLAGCERARPVAAVSEPSVDGSRVRIPRDSPQLGAVGAEAPREARPAALRLNGRLAWDENATVRVYSPFAGRVTRIEVEPGQRVEAGAVLARLASSDYGEAEADARKSASDLRLAERTLVRVRDLFEHGAAARKDLDAAEADQARARSESQRAAARLAAYGAEGTSIDGSFPLRTPIAGVVVERNLGPGQEVRPDQILAGTPQLAAPLFTVTDPTRLWVMLDVSEHDAPHLRAGTPLVVHVHLDPSQAVAGRVEMVSEFLDPTTRTLRVRGALPNADRKLRAEMLVRVDIEPDDQAPVPEVPVAAVFLQGEKHFVYVEEEPGSFERREVAIGPERDGWLPVLSGLEPGRRVVTRGAILLEKIFQDRTAS
ncbi:MAG TPA: efflux RND transporter periplasmic adaptor subunit [Myxococcota bacterium]|nr:efflux RND transporter periplasmic adaptor subunit [Myxococcota bacterium]